MVDAPPPWDHLEQELARTGFRLLGHAATPDRVRDYWCLSPGSRLLLIRCYRASPEHPLAPVVIGGMAAVRTELPGWELWLVCLGPVEQASLEVAANAGLVLTAWEGSGALEVPGRFLGSGT